MKIDIVTPCYNTGKYLEECIATIANQNYPDYSHYVVDGNSTDNTVEILKKHEDKLSWVSEPDNGQTDAINKGLRMADGDILAWQNADDIYLPGCFEKVAAFFKNNPDVYMVYGYYQRIDENGNKLGDIISTDYKSWKLKYSRFIPVQPCVFFRKEVFEELGMLDESLNYCMDVDLYSRIDKNLKIARMPEMLGAFRVHQESKTQNPDNYKVVKKELLSVLSKHYNYNFIDRIIFELMQLRSRIATILKDRTPL